MIMCDSYVYGCGTIKVGLSYVIALYNSIGEDYARCLPIFSLATLPN